MEQETKKNQETENTQELNIEQQKQDFLKSEKKTISKNNGIPLYLAGMLIILALLLGIIIASFVLPQNTTPTGPIIPDVNNFDEDAYRTVPITMIYTNECTSCIETNTIEDVFLVRQIPYEMKKVEASSEEGQQLINTLQLKTLPTALINQEKMGFYPKLKEIFEIKAKLKSKNGFYIAPELNLDEKTCHSTYFIEKIGGICNSEKPTIVYLADYYEPGVKEKQKLFYDFVNDFNESMNMNFVFAQSNSIDKNAVLTNIFLSCASQQGKYLELEKQITGIYCNNPVKGDETILTLPEINGCKTLSNHYGTSLTQMELDIALGRTAIDQNAFLGCFNNQEQILTNAKYTAEELDLTKVYPGGVFLIDCKELVAIEALKETFCARHPEETNCKKEVVDETEN